MLEPRYPQEFNVISRPYNSLLVLLSDAQNPEQKQCTELSIDFHILEISARTSPMSCHWQKLDRKDSGQTEKYREKASPTLWKDVFPLKTFEDNVESKES